ncbi:OmpA family protein [Myroides odoratus]|uniref:OmpA family protein n=1 Tax=Myroides odoratus TaxID=256 RepID=UPI000765AC43|nr:OmpA family protein [Myroides odoratus]
MVQYLYKSVLLCLCLTSLNSLGQTRKERKADHNFDTYAYIEAIKVYENIANKGFINTSILSKLGDSYYFNGKLVEAHQWYAKLFEDDYPAKDLATLDKEYYYRYAQTLKAIGEPEKADAILQEFASVATADSRSILLLTHTELEQQTISASRFAMANLTINSPYSDYGATLLDDQLIFTSSRPNEEVPSKVHPWTNEPYTQLYATTLTADGTFTPPIVFAKEIASSELNRGSAVFMQEGKRMYFTSNNGLMTGSKRAKYDKEDTALVKIYQATKQANGHWGNVEELPFNMEGYNTAHPALTPDGKWMYFVSDRPGSVGASDLFRVAIYESNRFGAVEHLGDAINTAGRETFPFISKEYNLYFSSDGHPGFGGLDVYKAKINHDGRLGVVVNVGPDLNSSFDDFGFYIDNASNKGFVSSNKEGGQGGDDVYLIVEKPCIQLVMGIVSDLDTQQALEKAEVQVMDTMQQQVNQVNTDEEGYYRLNQLRCGQHYRIRISKAGYFTKELTLTIDRNQQRRLDIALESSNITVESGDDLFKKLKLEPIYFDFAQFAIRPDAQIELMKVVDVLQQFPNLHIEIRSHTDSRGDDTYNLMLSERRAQATRQWIIKQGIDATRLKAKGYGESQLLNECSNGIPCEESQHQLNRRSEFIVGE